VGTPEQQREWKAWSDQLGQSLADDLNRDIRRKADEMQPGPDWSTWMLGQRLFRLSPDQTKALELVAGEWRSVLPEYVRARRRES
jgi:hypothetical protein